MGAKKNFVIDTNVILHDYNCLKNFQENDIRSGRFGRFVPRA